MPNVLLSSSRSGGATRLGGDRGQIANMDAMNARRVEIRAQQKALGDEDNELMHALYCIEDAPLLGRFFRRIGLSIGDVDSDWVVWTRVDSYSPDRGAIGVEFRFAGEDWYDVKLEQRVKHAEAGEEITRDEFYAAIRPLIDRLSKDATERDSAPSSENTHHA